jgi:hypothetical protein
VRRSLASKDFSMKVEGIAGLRSKATIGKYIANCDDLSCALVRSIVGNLLRTL